LKVLDACFVTSAVDARGVPADGIPHVALVGRSNVGKSTVINALARSQLARTSAAAGKTRLANLYRLTLEGGPGGAGRWTVYLADLPGYGYARGVPRQARGGPSAPNAGTESVGELARVADSYFSGRTTYRVAGVLHLVDARHPGLAADVEAADWLDAAGLARVLVATKVDKLSRAERAKNLGELERKLGMAALPISARGGEGLDDLWRLIANLSRQR
jgi:GTP-binding protein